MALFPANEITVVDLAKPAPTGVTTQVLIKTPRNPDYFATTTFSRTPKFDKNSDMASPVPLAASAVKNAGQKDASGKSTEQRIIVVGCKNIGANAVLEAAQPAVVGNQLVNVKVFPSNEDFTRNSILWLSGYENMIAVSSKANATARIVVGETALSMIRFVVLPLAAVLALLIGGMVWLVRRR